MSLSKLIKENSPGLSLIWLQKEKKDKLSGGTTPVTNFPYLRGFNRNDSIN